MHGCGIEKCGWNLCGHTIPSIYGVELHYLESTWNNNNVGRDNTLGSLYEGVHDYVNNICKATLVLMMTLISMATRRASTI
jgi:hypothetical protein